MKPPQPTLFDHLGLFLEHLNDVFVGFLDVKSFEVGDHIGESAAGIDGADGRLVLLHDPVTHRNPKIVLTKT